MIQEAIQDLLEGKDLGAPIMKGSMEELMGGLATQSQIGAFLALLRIKGETVEEITQAAAVMREKASSIDINGVILDTCSTGGSGLNHLNVSTAAAFVAAGAGVRVAKHGNRAASGKCGSADVLEKLGVKIDLEPEQVKKCLEKAGIGFLFAPKFHKAMKHAAGPRKELGIRTIFNILGPLTNPASATHQLLGVYDAGLTGIMAEVLGNLGVRGAMVVHGAGGLDEISLSGKTRVSELKNGKVKTYEVSPDDFGLPLVGADDMKGGMPDTNAEYITRIFNGEKTPYRDVVIANSAACLVITGVAGDLREGVEAARASLDSGKALDKLRELAEISNTV
ncbi:MAG: anthranilate phosphoribosyltransferase [Elusimicrobia bacterium]|nr:anthranilate phosphoribosyltransferase [Elusimicrobiota bacterium]